MKVVQEFNGKLVDNLCMKNGWGKTFNEKDYVKFINSVDGLTYSNENLMAITYPKRRKTPNFSYGDIRRVHRIYVSN